ncbi:MAG: peptide deformylase [Thermomicrobiales bacterium]|nr:peptide deformylase [Thermomicrobiales bacterium]
MPLMEIILEGDPRLRQKATKVRAVDDGLRKIAADMFETMLDAPGVGLAGPQVGVMRRIIVVHLPVGYVHEDDPEVSLTLINPEIVKGHGRESGQEGCLSIPGWVGDVPRMTSITVKGMDLDNRHIRLKAEGMLARVLQHEIDHLDGILFVDRVEDRSTLFEIPEEEERAELLAE